MGAESLSAVTALNGRFLLDFPVEAARQLETLPSDDVAEVLAEQPARIAVNAWEVMASDVASTVLGKLDSERATHILAEANPIAAVGALAQLGEEEREGLISSLDPQVAQELRELMAYPEDSAGRLMDRHITALRAGLTVAEAIERLRSIRRQGIRELFVVDDEGRLVGRVETHAMAIADPGQPISAIQQPVDAVVKELDPREDVVGHLQSQRFGALPVVNDSGRFVGVIRSAALMDAVKQESSLDLQTMVGASADERALSPALFAVRKRLPWLQINLLTAFLAAAVVGMFESTIAQFTALAVLLPVVAGQSGNAGAQALAVTMRGLLLREISLRQWPRVVGKEAATGLVNGIAVAATTALGVYIWSGSVGLVLIIVLAMVISMVAAGLAGALVPIVLRKVGQDPATASSIILTTVTDVVGFFSFLGIATLLSPMLVAG